MGLEGDTSMVVLKLEEGSEYRSSLQALRLAVNFWRRQPHQNGSQHLQNWSQKCTATLLAQSKSLNNRVFLWKAYNDFHFVSVRCVYKTATSNCVVVFQLVCCVCCVVVCIGAARRHGDNNTPT